MKKTANPFITIILLLLVFSGCNIPSPKQVPGEPTPDLNLILTQIAEEQPTEIPTAEPSPTPEPTATPGKTETLTICLGKEPATLFFYDESSQAMWSVLESIYDGPFDTGDGEAVPVIFESINVAEETINVQRGDIIADVDGNPVELKPGTVFMPAEKPAGCIGSSCHTTWSAIAENAQIKQTVITFHMKKDLFWNDGTPLTAEDSVFSMSVNGMKGIHASKRVYNLTAGYSALDESTVEWRGLPGYRPDDPSEVFWIPLPRHVMKGMSAEMIRNSEEINTKPLGWGAWQIVSWQKGQEIVAERNPYYVPADGTKPFFDRIVYKFYGRPGDNNLEALYSGTCDIIDTSVDLSDNMEEIVEGVRDGKNSAYIRPELTRQELVLNLDPVGYGAMKLFSDPELRTAIAQCIDRPALIRKALFGQSEIPVDFYPEGFSEHDPKLEPVGYDPEKAAQALDELGWTISETGTRTAAAVSGIPYGTELSFILNTGDSDISLQIGEMIRDNLEQCGIYVTHEPLSIGELYAQGPDGTVFGRSFDAAVFAWAAGSNACSIYMSDRIPTEINHWVGTNVGSYRNEAYDAACLIPEDTETSAGQIYAEELPVIPLYFNISVALSDKHICRIQDRIGSRSILWNMEEFTRSDTACAVSQWNNIYQ